MTFDVKGLQVSLVTESDLSDKQYHIVKAGTTDYSCAVCSAVTDRPIGVVYNTAGLGGATTIILDGIVRVKVGATPVTVGEELGTDTNGLAAAAGAGDYVIGQALQAGAAGEIIGVLLDCKNPYKKPTA